ncbi:MAG: GntR family transcriptional regulator [Actinomycetota bacterium]|nr:GntR family transcriptional regulator [Actinomycetota bacterium]
MRASLAAAEHRPLREIARAKLFKDIVRGKFRPGEKLNETHLALSYGISRGPVREALRVLEGQGLVRFVAHKGAVVTLLSREDIREIHTIRIALEGLGARLGASNLSDKDITQMRRLVARMEESSDTAQWLTLNNELHMTLYRASKRERLLGMIAELMNALQPYIILNLDLHGHLAELNAEHQALVRAAARRDAELCESLTMEHLRAAAELIASVVAS